MVKIFSGDDTDFKGDQRLALTFAAPDVDFDGCTAEVEFLGQKRTFAQVTNGGRLVFSFTADETRGMRCGVWPVIIRLRDSAGRVRTVNNTNRIKVTNDVNEAYADGEQELAVALTSGGVALPEIPAELDVKPDDNVGDFKRKFNSLLELLRNVAALAVMFGAFATFAASVATAPLDDIPGTAQVVTNVTLDAAPDFSTNNAALVETIEAKAPTPDLSPFLRKDLGQSGFQEFGGFLSGMGFHITHEVSNFNGWNNYTAKNGPTQPFQSLPDYIRSNPWDFQKRGEAIPTTGGVFNVSTMHFAPRLSVGPWNASIRPYDISGGSGAAFVFGDNLQTKKSNTMTLGVGVLNTNEWSFIWSGDSNRYYMPTVPSMSNPYATRYNGGFHVNPSVRSGMVNPLQNFWIGDTNLNDWIVTLSPPATWATLSGKPTNISAFSNDAGYLTGYTETDPTISAWAKAANKPTYTASEVGATTPADVTAAIREQSLGGIWDETLQVWWTPRMRNGSLTYEATTNVNLNAEN